MAGPASRRRNPPRRCRVSQSNEHKQLSDIPVANDSSQLQDQSHVEKQQVLQTPSEHPSDSDTSEYEASSAEQDIQNESNSSDLEAQDEEVVPRKRTQRPRSSTQTNRKKTNRALDENQQARREQSVELSEKHTKLLNEVFSAFDPHENGRISLSDILRVADDHGFGYDGEEVRDMIRFWDTAGTVTVSREIFTKLAVEAKFVTPVPK